MSESFDRKQDVGQLVRAELAGSPSDKKILSTFTGLTEQEKEGMTPDIFDALADALINNGSLDHAMKFIEMGEQRRAQYKKNVQHRDLIGALGAVQGILGASRSDNQR